MGILALHFSDMDSLKTFMADNPGFEVVSSPHRLSAIYGETEPWEPSVGDRIAMDFSGMPQPWPVVVGYDGMHPASAGVAMKATPEGWAPVSRFSPPLPPEQQALSEAEARRRYEQRILEH